MKKLFLDADKEIPDDVIYEIIILHNLGVSMEDLKYLLALRMETF
jgi:hypothetical protein